MLHEAWYLSIGTLPEKAKAVAKQRLQTAKVSNRHRAEFDRMIEFIDRGASIDGQVLRMKIEDLDFKRKQNLRDFLPELADAIDY
jgi:hypothetical protein